MLSTVRLWLSRLGDVLDRHRKPLKAALLFACLAVTLVLLFYHFRSNLLSALNAIAHFLSSSGPWGVLLSGTLLLVCSFPPVIGYSLLLTLNGFVYGIGPGFAINYCFAVMGATLCFAVSRRWLLRRRQKGPPPLAERQHRYRPERRRSRPRQGDGVVEGSPVPGDRTRLLASDGRAVSPSPAMVSLGTHGADGLQTAGHLPGSSSSHSISSALSSADQRSRRTNEDGPQAQAQPSPQPSNAGDLRSATPATVITVELEDEAQEDFHQEPPTSTTTQSRMDQYRSLMHALDRYLTANPKETLRLALLLRLAPYPFTVMNAMLGQVGAVRYRDYLIATAVSTLKVILHTWAGSMLGRLDDLLHRTEPSPQEPEDGGGGWSTAELVDIVVLGMAILFGVASGAYLYRVIQRALQEYQDPVEFAGDSDGIPLGAVQEEVVEFRLDSPAV